MPRLIFQPCANRIPRCLIGLTLALALVTACHQCQSSERGSADDGWRRTAAGWENKESWPLTPAGLPPALTSDEPNNRPRRIDSHPAALALLQLIAVLAGFFTFPLQGALDTSRSRESWLSGLSRSFRSSAFGA